jgi:hypothetical protein
MTAQEKAKYFIHFKKDLLENIDCFTSNFTQLQKENHNECIHVLGRCNRAT